MTDSQLTCEAKAAIRKYMITLVALPGILTAVLGFAFGYLVNDVAKEKAYNDAYKQAASLILKLYDEISSMKQKAKEAEEKTANAMRDSINVAKNIRELNKELVLVQDEAQSIRKQLKTAESFQKADDIVKRVADSLAARSDFKESVVKTSEKNVKNFQELSVKNRRSIEQVSSALTKLSGRVDKKQKEMDASLLSIKSFEERIEKLEESSMTLSDIIKDTDSSFKLEDLTTPPLGMTQEEYEKLLRDIGDTTQDTDPFDLLLKKDNN